MFKTILVTILLIVLLVASVVIYWTTISYVKPDLADSVREVVVRLDWKYVEPGGYINSEGDVTIEG